jgi:hypothetical protein
MRAQFGRVVAFAALLASSSLPASPADSLRECAARAGQEARSLDALEQKCPELTRALEDLGYANMLSPEQRRLTSSGLADLAALAARYQAGRSGIAPDIAPVRSIVDGLAREQERSSWWDALKAWLRSLLARDGHGSLSWLNRLLSGLATAAGVTTFLAYALLLIVAAVFVIIELRAMGLFARRERNASSASRSPTGASPRAEMLLQSAALTDKPAILLKLLVDGLSRKGRLQAERHLTHRELAARAVLDAAQRAQFAKVAGAAEGLLYGPAPRSTEGVERIIEEGRELLSQIQRLSGAA